MVTNELEPKAIKIIHESRLWLEEDPKWTMSGMGNTNRQSGGGGHELNLYWDSYIFCYTGRRGGGKSISMTWFALRCVLLYGMRLISNYPIECYIRRLNGSLFHVKSEPLDLYRLLCFDSDYTNCLIVIDEAPDIVSHLASMTWKNRLLNIWIRQLRKNRNSLIMGAQELELVDKSMRWQVDVIVACKDAAKKYGWAPSERGMCILQTWLDNSGMWTGETWQEEMKRANAKHQYKEVGVKKELYPRWMWDDETHKAIYDTYQIQDVFESLRKVDLKLGSIEVNGRGDQEATLNYYAMARDLLLGIKKDGGKIVQTEFWGALPDIPEEIKQDISKKLSKIKGFNKKGWVGHDRAYDITKVSNEDIVRVFE